MDLTADPTTPPPPRAGRLDALAAPTGMPSSRPTRCSRRRSATRASTTGSRTRRPRAQASRAPVREHPRPGRRPRRRRARRRRDHAADAARGARADIAESRHGLLAWNVDPLDGVPVEFLQRARLPAGRDPAGRPAMVERWRAMAGYTDLHLDDLRRTLADGLVACRAPGRADGRRSSPSCSARSDEDWPLLGPLARRSRTCRAGPTAERERFATDLRRRSPTGSGPAFARLHDALVDRDPAGRAARRPARPVPRARRRGRLPRPDPRRTPRWTSTPGRSTASASTEIERIDAELAELAGRTIGTREPARRAGRLRGDPALHFETRDEVFAKAASRLDRATEAIPDWFGRLPVAPCEVVRMGAHEEEHSTIAYYRQPADDGSRPGQYYINTAAPEDPAALRGGGARLPRVRSPGTTSRSPSPRSSRPAGVPAPPRARPRSSRAGACTRSA